MSSPTKIQRQDKTKILHISVTKKRNAVHAKRGWVRSRCAQGENTFNTFSFVEEEAVVFGLCGDMLKSYRQTGCVRRSRGANSYIVRILQEDAVIRTAEAVYVNYRLLCVKIRAYGVHIKVVEWIQSFLAQRSF